MYYQCEKCGVQKWNSYNWCYSCQRNNLKENFENWTSGNEKIDNFIQERQLNINYCDDTIFEWIPYNQFYNLKETEKDGFATVLSAIWKDGSLYYDMNEKKYKRNQNIKVVLKCLYITQNITDEFLNEV